MTLRDWFDLLVFFAEVGGIALIVMMLALTLFVLIHVIESWGGLDVRDRQDRW